ncbi:MAG: 30S ribosomal protein S3 [Candidatus Portiera sp.]|nr:30S ribosomal protein S3 [Portiera sp.]
MGQKVHPIGMRLGVIKRHSAIWYAEKGKYTENLRADLSLRKAFEEKLARSSVSEIIIERESKKIQITIRTASPGVVIGRKGAEIENLTALASKQLGVSKNDIYINIQEIVKPELEARLVGENIARQLERRIMFRRAMKRAVFGTMSAGAEGVKVQVGGRLGGADIARTESYKEGRVPLHTLRADIDYASVEALTTYGIIGVKVWIFRGEIFDVAEQFNPTISEESRSSRRPKSKGRREDGKDNSRSGDNRPRSGDNRPRSGDNRPRFGDNRPRSGDNRPRSGDNRPRSGDNNPRSGDNNPRSGDNKDKPAIKAE